MTSPAREKLHALVCDLERDLSLFEPDRLRQRIEVIDLLEAYFACKPPQDPGSESDSIYDRARTLGIELETANQRAYQAIRQQIRSGAGLRDIAEWTTAAGWRERGEPRIGSDRYDYLDTLLSGILQIEEPALGIAELAAEMVFYQPTPARHIVDMLDRIELTERDVLIDLGSGLGHVPLLAAICTQARCVGIELEAVYVDCAQRCANALNLSNATFVHQDVRASDLAQGTVFYMYTPFTGKMMDAVLGMLRTEAGSRAIRICTLGPCTLAVAREPWLESSDAPTGDRLALFRSI